MIQWSEISIMSDPGFVGGATTAIGGHKYRIIGRLHDDDPFTLLVAPAGWRYWWRLVIYRLWRSLSLTGKFIVAFLDIWGLADWDPVTVPTWDCIRPLRWLAAMNKAGKRLFRRVR